MSKLKKGAKISWVVQGHECLGQVLEVEKNEVVVKFRNGNVVRATKKQSEEFRVSED